MRAAVPPGSAKYTFKGCKILKSCQKPPARLGLGFLRMATRAGRSTSHPWQTPIHDPCCSLSVSFSMIKLENSFVSAVKGLPFHQPTCYPFEIRVFSFEGKHSEVFSKKLGEPTVFPPRASPQTVPHICHFYD